MSAFVFNAAHLIEEVKKRPGLWNPDCPTDRDEKLSLWKDIGASMFQDWSQQNKSSIYDRVIHLQKKWRSLRDGYNRELRSLKSGVRARKRVYKHFKRLSFLGGYDGDINELVEEEDNEEEETEEVGASEAAVSLATFSAALKSRKRRRERPASSSSAEEEAPLVVDSNKLFLLSFLPELKQLPLHTKMWVRTQIARVMQEAVASQYNDTTPRMATVRIKRSSSTD